MASPLARDVTGTVPKTVVPDLNVTVPDGESPKLPPVGFALLCVSTNAVSVKFVLGAIEVTLELIAVVVGPAVTVKGTAVETALAL